MVMMGRERRVEGYTKDKSGTIESYSNSRLELEYKKGSRIIGGPICKVNLLTLVSRSRPWSGDLQYAEVVLVLLECKNWPFYVTVLAYHFNIKVRDV